MHIHALHKPAPAPLFLAPAPGHTDGQLEAIKWLALASMLLDHVGRLVLGYEQASWVFAGGRLAFPLFAWVLAINLARGGDAADRAERIARVALRLGFWCAVSVAPSVWARGEPQLVNVLGTLGLGAVLCWLWAGRLAPLLRLPIGLAVLLAAPHVEFGLPGVLLVPAAWLAVSGPRTAVGVAGALAALAMLGLVAALNARPGGAAALAATLAALPLALAVRALPLALPRLRHAFYVVYPVHLALIGAWRGLA